MEEYIEKKETYTIDNKEYIVISRTKKESDLDKIYNVLSRYALQKLECMN